MQKRVGILIYSLAGGGAERVVSYLLNYLESKGVIYFLFLMNDDVRYALPENVRICYLEKSRPDEGHVRKILKIPYLSFKYYRLLHRYKIEVSISFLTRPNYINMLTRIYRRTTKIILSERAYPSLEYSGNSMKANVNRYLIKNIYQFADLVISNSVGNANDLIENFHLNPNRIRVIYNPVDSLKIDAIAKKSGFFDKQYINFVSVGRLDDGKNHIHQIEAVELLRNPAVRLYIFGDGKNYTSLLNKIKELKLENQIILMGFKENIFEYLKAADCFLFSSKHEGFPNVLIEAMACSIPIISINCKSGPDEILLGKVVEIENLIINRFGILVPENNLVLFTDAIKFFLKNRDYFIVDRIALLKKLTPFNKELILANYIECIMD